jgi:hypothetical protein
MAYPTGNSIYPALLWPKSACMYIYIYIIICIENLENPPFVSPVSKGTIDSDSCFCFWFFKRSGRDQPGWAAGHHKEKKISISTIFGWRILVAFLNWTLCVYIYKPIWILYYLTNFGYVYIYNIGTSKEHDLQTCGCSIYVLIFD